jgi:hypothetical protein
VLNATGAGTKYPTDGCEGDCAAPAFKYECDGTKCVENATGTYVTVDCDKKCAAPPAAYACTGAACVGTAGGPYSTSVRTRLCQLSISIVLIVTAQHAARHHAQDCDKKCAGPPDASLAVLVVSAGALRDKSDCHFRKIFTEYDRKPFIKCSRCTAK